MRNPLAGFGRGRKGTPDGAGTPAPPPAAEPHDAPPPPDGAIALTILALELSGAGAGSADQARLQIKVNVRHGAQPRIIRSWEVSAHIAGRYELGHEVTSHSTARPRPASAGYDGGFPRAHERTKWLHFVLPGISRQEFLDNLARSELVLRATDELGARWSTRLDLIALRQPG